MVQRVLMDVLPTRELGRDATEVDNIRHTESKLTDHFSLLQPHPQLRLTWRLPHSMIQWVRPSTPLTTEKVQRDWAHL